MLQWMAALNKIPNFAELLDFKDAQIENLKIKNSIGMEFIGIPSGVFMMGSPKDEKGRSDDETQHEVTLTKGFLMQTTPVTQAQRRSSETGLPVGAKMGIYRDFV